LLTYDLDTQTFKTTEKGLRSLETYKKMDSLIKAVNNNNDNNSRYSREERIDYNHTGSMILINAQSYIMQASKSIALVYNDSIKANAKGARGSCMPPWHIVFA
jgi:hypothetical protein